MEAIKLTKDTINQAYDGWFYTILGAGGDLNEWFKGYQEICDKEKIGKIPQWYQTTGKVLNDAYDLQGKNRFKANLTILLFSYEGMNVGKLAMLKLKMGDRWFTDIIDNSRPQSYYDMEEEEEE